MFRFVIPCGSNGGFSGPVGAQGVAQLFRLTTLPADVKVPSDSSSTPHSALASISIVPRWPLVLLYPYAVLRDAYFLQAHRAFMVCSIQ